MINLYIQLIWFGRLLKNQRNDCKIERVLITDYEMSVVRHVDADYDEAIEFAKEKDIKVPMIK